MTPAEQIAFWSDKLRDMAATGLKYSQNIYDHERYQALQQIAIEMLALATERPVVELEPLRESIFSRSSPLVAGTAAIINDDAEILLMRRSDNRLWNMPGGILEVGETPAAGVVREALEETGLRCEPIALVGVYDNRMWETGVVQHLYKFTFLCKPLDAGQSVETISHAVETLETGWFAEHLLPDDLFTGHVQRVRDAFRVWRGEQRAYFDR
ncbi:MAG: NUDIX hydrolase N-terminal domain-containing protein [Roseiflexaceae bacterium]